MRIKCPKCGFERNWIPMINTTLSKAYVICPRCNKQFRPYHSINNNQIVSERRK